MMQKLIIVDNPDRIDSLLVYLSDKEYIAFDCETNGLHKGAEIIGMSFCADEGRAFYVILSAWNTQLQSLVALPTKNRAIELIEALKGKSLIMHNGVFDCAMVESNYKISLIEYLHTDTMILAHLLNENRRVGLKELAKEYFGEDAAAESEEMKASVVANGGTTTKKNYEMYKADPYIMGKYGAKDALLTYNLFYTLVPQLYEQNLDEFFYKDESMPLLRGPTYELNTLGLKIDQKALIELKSKLKAECEEAKAFIYKEIHNKIKDKYPGTNKKNTFSIGSSQQLSWLLFGEYGLEFSTLTKGGKAVAKTLGLKHYSLGEKRNFINTCLSEVGKVFIDNKKLKLPWAYIACDKATLTKLASKYKWIQRLLEYQQKMKLLTTYVKGIEDRIQYGVIHPSYLQHGTTSGRYSSRNPNFQNLPRDDKRVKSCIKARQGKVFIGGDYSQLEPRVFAFYSKDERLLKAFKGSDDFYSVIGMEVYGKSDCIPQKEGSPEAFGIKYKKLRDLSKVIALASTYGASAYQLMKTTGKNVEDTQADMDSYFNKFPGVAKMMLDAHEEAKKNGVVYNIFGRPRRIPEAIRITKLYGNITHAELPYEARGWLNLAVNHRIQSTGASIVNRAAIRLLTLSKESGIKCQIVAQVHDSLVVECDEQDAENISILLKEAMENTITLEGIELEAIPRIGYTLADV